MVIERGRSFIESPRVPGIRESLEVQMVTKFVTQSTQESSKRGDLFAYRRFHPRADKNGIGVVVAEKFDCRSLPDTEGSGGENPYVAVPYLIEIGCGIEKVPGNSENLFGPSRLHGGFDGLSNSLQPIILRQP